MIKTLIIAGLIIGLIFAAFVVLSAGFMIIYAWRKIIKGGDLL